MTNKELQLALIARGYAPGVVDGRIGKRTKAAIRLFQRDAGLVVDGIAGPITRDKLEWPLGAIPIIPIEVKPPDHGVPKMSEKGLLALAIREAVVLQTYRDSVGVLTIGIGHSAAAGAPKPVLGLRISLVQALSLFRRDVVAYEDDVRAALKVSVLPHAFDALVSFHYNTGGIGRAVLTRFVNEGNKSRAAIEAGFRGWLKPPEVEERRMSEFRQFVDGDYGDLSRIPVYEHVTAKHTPDRKTLRFLPTRGLLV